MFLSVIVPAHNAAGLIESTVERLRDRLAGQHAEIIVVENGSADDTFERCARMSAEWTDPGVAFTPIRCDKGMGEALRTGILASHGDFVLLTADDLPFGFDDLDALGRMRQDPDRPIPAAIIGSKSHPNSVVHRGAYRGLMTWGFGVLRWLTLGMRTGDPQGTFILSGDLARQLAPEIREPGFLFTTELAYVLERLGIRPVEIPVRLEAHHASHGSRVAMHDVMAMATGLLRLRRRHHRRWDPQLLAR